mmetsp:Transcript_13784/g.38081  ORF Transcript_13784/g.38081 Transcript_13784/m.38081 type:complete len:90 (+) Transcript_13784:763-1032(+)
MIEGVHENRMMLLFLGFGRRDMHDHSNNQLHLFSLEARVGAERPAAMKAQLSKQENKLRQCDYWAFVSLLCSTSTTTTTYAFMFPLEAK